FKFLTYDSNYDTNKFQLNAIKLDITDFFSTTTTFPFYNTSQSFSSVDFYDNFLNDFHEFKIRIITEKETQQDAGIEVNLAIGDFKTYVQAKTDYLNYDEFESNGIQGRHISDKISLTSDGVELTGFSGFNIKETHTSQKFYDNFWKNEWILLGAQQGTMTISRDIIQDTKVSAANPNMNYDGQDLRVSTSPEYETYIELDQINYLIFGDTDTYELKVDIGNQPWDYTGLSSNFAAQDGFPRSIRFHDGYWWMVGSSTDKVYKYTDTWTYTGLSYDVSGQDTIPKSIYFQDGYWWMLGARYDTVYKYTDTWTYTGLSYSVSSQSTVPTSIYFQDGYWWMLGFFNTVYKYTDTWTYTGLSYDVSGQDTIPESIAFQDGYWWMVGLYNKKVFKYTDTWTYTGLSYD
ncbi:hypothetical protein LCGC14_2821070, partial [marine sediment metagenome]